MKQRNPQKDPARTAPQRAPDKPTTAAKTASLERRKSNPTADAPDAAGEVLTGEGDPGLTLTGGSGHA